MATDATNPEVGASGSGKKCSSLGSSNTPEFSPEHNPKQEAIAFLRRDFAAEATLSLAATGWRVAALMLGRAVEDLEARRLRQRRTPSSDSAQQFIEGSIAFRQSPWVIDAIADAIRAGAVQ